MGYRGSEAEPGSLWGGDSDCKAAPLPLPNCNVQNKGKRNPVHLPPSAWTPNNIMVLSLFILASSVCKSLQCLISSLTQGGKGGHLFRLTRSIVLWGGRNTVNKYCWHVWGVLKGYGPHWVCPTHSVCAFPIYTAQAQGALQGHCPKWALHFVHFPGLSYSGSGSQILCKGTDLVGHAFCALSRHEQLR